MNRNMLFAALTVAVLAIAGVAYVVSDGFKHADEYDSEIVDMAGRTVGYKSDPQRIAMLGPSALRLYCYAGDMDKIVGIESVEFEWGDLQGRPYMLAYEDYFKTLKTDIGSGGPRGVPDVEKLLDANLDILFITLGLENAELDDLQNKIKTPVIKLTYGVNAPFDEGLYKAMGIIGEISGSKEKAESAVNFIKGVKNDFNERTKGIPEAERVTAYIGALSFGGSHGLNSTTKSYNLFQELNIKNAYDEYLKKTGKTARDQIHLADWEYVQGIDPGLVVVDEGGLNHVVTDYGKHPDRYNEMKAFKDGNVIVQMSFNWYAANLEMVMANGYFIGKTYYPEKFEDVDIKEKFDEITTKLLGKPLYDKVKDRYPYSFGTWNTKSHDVVYPEAPSGYTIEKGAEGEAFRGTEVTFTVKPTAPGSVATVKVNGDEIIGTDGKYSFKLLADSTITVEIT